MVTQAKHVVSEAHAELNKHSFIKAFIMKFSKDNVGMLGGYVAWNILTSLVPILVGLVAISTLFLRSPSAQRSVETHLSQALQGVFTATDITHLVHTSLQHQGLLWIVGLIGALWGGSNVGGAYSTAFQAIFETQGRNFIKEKLLDVVMIFVFTALMLVILVATGAGSMLSRLFAGFPLPGVVQFVIGTAISLGAAFLLFASIYLSYPNIQPKFKLRDIWPGAIVAAVLFEIITYIWPIYAHFSNFNRYGAIFVPILVLTAWIYFFSMISLIGAEVAAVRTIRAAKSEGQSIGPPPGESVPQHDVLRETRPASKGSKQESGNQANERDGTTTRMTFGRVGSPQHAPTAGASSASSVVDGNGELKRDPAFWLLSATPLVVGTLAGIYQIAKEGSRR